MEKEKTFFRTKKPNQMTIESKYEQTKNTDVRLAYSLIDKNKNQF